MSAARRLLLINPNTSTSTTERLRQVLTPTLPAAWALDAHTARFGASYISCEASAAVAAHAARYGHVSQMLLGELMEARAQLLHQHPILDLQVRQHGSRGNPAWFQHGPAQNQG